MYILTRYMYVYVYLCIRVRVYMYMHVYTILSHVPYPGNLKLWQVAPTLAAMHIGLSRCYPDIYLILKLVPAYIFCRVALYMYIQ